MSRASQQTKAELLRSVADLGFQWLIDVVEENAERTAPAALLDVLCMMTCRNAELVNASVPPAESTSASAYRELFLSNGTVVKLDPEDHEILETIPWHLKTRKGSPRVLYAQHTIGGGGRYVGTRKTIAMHRLIVGAKPGEQCDHINGDTLDNRRCNLRLCTARENSQNVTLSKQQKAGGYKGVTWHKQGRKWEAGTCSGPPTGHKGKRRRQSLGLFADPVEAAHTVDREQMRAFGEFATLNFPENGAAHAVDVGMSAVCGHPGWRSPARRYAWRTSKIGGAADA